MHRIVLVVAGVLVGVVVGGAVFGVLWLRERAAFDPIARVVWTADSGDPVPAEFRIIAFPVEGGARVTNDEGTTDLRWSAPLIRPLAELAPDAESVPINDDGGLLRESVRGRPAVPLARDGAFLPIPQRTERLVTWREDARASESDDVVVARVHRWLDDVRFEESVYRVRAGFSIEPLRFGAGTGVIARQRTTDPDALAELRRQAFWGPAKWGIGVGAACLGVVYVVGGLLGDRRRARELPAD